MRNVTNPTGAMVSRILRTGQIFVGDKEAMQASYW
jgi:hypothetical protein